MRISPVVVRIILFITMSALIISLGLCYYYGTTTEYVFEVYLFMTAACFCWGILAVVLMVFLPRLVLSKRQAWIAIHGHISFAKIVNSYTTETRTTDNKIVTHVHNVVQIPDGNQFTIDYNPLYKTNDGIVFIRYDESTAVFDNKTMRLIRKKKITEDNFNEYIAKNENYAPVPDNISGYKTSIFGKKIIFILLGIIIFANYITPTIIILSSKTNNVEVKKVTTWSEDIKTKSKNILGFELPEFDLEYNGSYFVSDAKQKLYDSNGNSGYLYPNADEFSFNFLSTNPSDDKLSAYATYLSTDYGFTKNYDILDLESYKDNISACNETNQTSSFHYIQLKKGNTYIVITKSYREGYYTYMNYAADLKKGVWITCIKMQ